MDVIDYVPELLPRAAHVHQAMHDKLVDHQRYVVRYGEDMPDIRQWRWSGGPTRRMAEADGLSHHGGRAG